MKTICKLKWLIALTFVLNLQSTIINLQSTHLYAQNPQLFEHTWYLNNIVIENVTQNSPSPENEILLYFFNDIIEVTIPFCNDEHGGFVNFNPDNIFNINNFDWVLLGSCNSAFYPEFFDFITNHYNFYIDINIGPYNPFTYTLEPIDNYLQLTITNSEGDFAVYNSVLLSTTAFTQNSFALYPNPAKETLFIGNSFGQEVQAKVYNVSGKLLQSQAVEVGETALAVSQLKSGLYFVVFESGTGEKLSKKFVKK